MSLIPFFKIQEVCERENIEVKGILFCGAYDGAEYEEYKEVGLENCLFVEPNPLLFQRLVSKVGRTKAIMAAVTDVPDQEISLNLAYSLDMTNLGCSSIFPLQKLLDSNKYIRDNGRIKVKTTTIDTILQDRPDINCLIMDIQGSELLALKGATKSLPQIQCIVTEFNHKAQYEGGCGFKELNEFLLTAGFKNVIMEYMTENEGDALYLKSSKTRIPQ